MTNSLTGAPLAGVAIATDPAIKDVAIKTDASGKYTGSLPIGSYTLSIKRDGFAAATQTASVVAGQSVTKDVALKPVSRVAVDAGKAQKAAAGGTVTLAAKAEPLDGSTVTGYEWVQVAGAPAKIEGAATASATVTLASAAAYKAELLKDLEKLDRFEVQAINPHALGSASTATFKVTATTSSGKYSGTVNVTTDLPYVINTGLRNVPVGVAVLMQGKDQRSYSWTLSAPAGSKAALDDATIRNPAFTPDVAGKYTLSEATSRAAVDVYAGTWAGAISGLDDKGRPLAATCSICHNNKIAPDQFTDWKSSGHAEIFTQNIDNPAGHWAITCAQCHTVGYNPSAKNGGFDEAVEAEGWKVPPHGELNYYAGMLVKFPKTAGLANIQCENCHGPNNSPLHGNGTIDAARVSLSSDVCGACHGEPLRHGRFQQWEESGHANYELAILESSVENRGAIAAHCGRCHSAQGFLAWIEQGDLTKQIQGKAGNATVDELKALGLTKDEVHPQTCAVCHKPHAVGTITGEPNNVNLRVSGDTPMLPAGYKATSVGRGAMCITCHNTRNGARNDAAGKPTTYSAPHAAAQGDVLMGQNAYFVEVGVRSKHSYIENTCTTCHMVESPPPAEFSYQLAGTNHSFEASMGICAKCHGVFTGGTLQESTEAKLHELGEKMSAYLLGKMGAQFRVKDYTPHTYLGKSYDVKSNDLTVDKANIASLEPTEPHGQQGFILKFRSFVTVTYAPTGEAPHSVSVSEVEVQLGDFTTDRTDKLIAADDPLVRAGWNYFLIHGDNSKGVHNPTFVMDVLNASLNALK